jgi:hypothetical protein
VHEEEEIVRKFLEALPDRFEQIAVAIETLLDLEDVSLDELVGRIKATEERLNRSKGRGGGGSGGGAAGKEIDGKLYFTEEQVIARLASRLNIDGSAARGKASSGPGKRRGDVGRGKERGKDARSGPPKGGNGGEDDEACHYCGKMGHWKRECRKKKRDEEKAAAAAAKQPQANLAQMEQEAPALYMAMVTPSETVIHGVNRVEHVFLNEHKVVADLDADGEHGEMQWYLDTGASNHMTGDASFSELNPGVIGSVRFGEIAGRGTVLFTSKDGGHRAFHDVYHIPRLRSSILGVGQLDEHGCKIEIEEGILRMWDRATRELLAKVKRTSNRLYILPLKPSPPVCLAASYGDEEWKWHARFGHLGFQALNKMGREGMVRGLPQIEHVEHVCDACLAGKQRRAPFPQAANYRAVKPLELIHGDLCGPVTPATPGGKRYIMLVVDDMSRYMWATLLANKSDAEEAFRKLRAGVEVESGRKIKAFCIDRGGGGGGG